MENRCLIQSVAQAWMWGFLWARVQHEPHEHVSCPCSLGLGPAVLTCFQVWPWVLTGVHFYVKDTLAPVVPHVGELCAC